MTEGQIAYANAELTESAPAGSQDTPFMTEMTNGKQRQLHDLESFQIADRANFTLAAFEALSRAVSGYPGRKNLIWLSTSFPVQIEADPNRYRNRGATPPVSKDQLATAGVAAG